jgi:Trypsin-like peptidase domain
MRDIAFGLGAELRVSGNAKSAPSGRSAQTAVDRPLKQRQRASPQPLPIMTSSHRFTCVVNLRIIHLRRLGSCAGNRLLRRLHRLSKKIESAVMSSPKIILFLSGAIYIILLTLPGRGDEVQVGRFPADSQVRFWSHGVGHLYLRTTDGNVRQLCSGIVIDSDKVLTAKHCGFTESTKVDLIGMQALFIVMGELNSFAGANEFDLDPIPIDQGKTDPDVDDVMDDYVVLRSKAPFESFAASIPKSVKTDATELVIYHFPLSGFISMTLSRDCEIIKTGADLGDYTIKHNCETDKGSSGAPIFNDNYELVGIHCLNGYQKYQPGTFSRGLSIRYIIEHSAVVRAALEGQKVVTAPTGSATSPDSQKDASVANALDKSTEIIKLADGNYFFKIDDNWYLHSKLKDTDIKLTKQRASSDALVLWDSLSDNVYSIDRLAKRVTSIHADISSEISEDIKK